MRIVCRKTSIVGLAVLIASGNASSEISFGELAGTALLSPPPSNLLFTRLAWGASPSPEVTGYALYYHATGLAITNRVDVGAALTANLPLLVGLAYSIHVVAYTADGVESEPSNRVQYAPPPLTQLRLIKLDGGGLQLRFRTSPLALCRVDWTDDLAASVWQLWVTVRADLNGDIVLNVPSDDGVPTRYYRAAKL